VPPPAPPKTDDQYRQEVTSSIHEALLVDINHVLDAVKDIRLAAPPTQGRGWDPVADADAILRMRLAWTRARGAYEHVEGALAPLFPDIDFALDSRYEDLLVRTGASGDSNLFDDQGIVGLDAVERILYAGASPQHVIDFEQSLPGYRPAAFPATEQEAADFKNKLCARLVSDAQALVDQWRPERIDAGQAFRGLISLVREQKDELNAAAKSREESRYSQRTVADMRDNLEGAEATYGLFREWLLTKATSADVDQKISDGFRNVEAVCAQVQGDAVPPPPATWNAQDPSIADLQTAFGLLYGGVKDAVDPAHDATVTAQMDRAAVLLGIAQ
jgi:iron uptake system component EfeO